MRCRCLRPGLASIWTGGRFVLQQVDDATALAGELDACDRPGDPVARGPDAAIDGGPTVASHAARCGISNTTVRLRLLNTQFTHDLSGLGCTDMPLAVSAAGALLQYVGDTLTQARCRTSPGSR